MSAIGLRLGLAALVSTMVVACGGVRRHEHSASIGPPVAKPKELGSPAQQAQLISQLVYSGVRTSMLAGNGLTVRDFLNDISNRAPEVGVRLFSNEGEQVYYRQQPPPPLSEVPEHIRRALMSGVRAEQADGGTVIPISNEKACRGCHEEGERRGVLTLGPRPQTMAVAPDPRAAALAVASLVHSSFQQMMVVGEVEHITEYLEALTSEMPGLKGAAVLSIDGEPTLGDAFLETPPSLVERALKPGPDILEEVEGELWFGKPLQNTIRCSSCHAEQGKIRGAMVLKFAAEGELLSSTEALILTSLKHVMLNGLGRQVRAVLSAAKTRGLVSRLALHDRFGRGVYDSEFQVSPPPQVARVLNTGEALAESGNAGPFLFRYTEPIVNEEACVRCHGENDGLRGAIEVTVLGKAGRVQASW